MPTANLAWNDNSNNEDNFILERKVGGGSFTELATLAANVATYSDADLTEDVTYVYRVLARNVVGDSAYSNELTVRFPFAPVYMFA